MPEITVHSNIDKVIRHMRELQDKGPEMMQRVVWDMTDYAAQLADDNCPVGTPAIAGVGKGGSSGTLKQSLFVAHGVMMGSFGYTALYAAYVEYGTPAHIIEPGAKGFLAWPIAGTQLGKIRGTKSMMYSKKSVAVEWVYTTKPVNHPGTQAVGWVRKAVDDAEQHLEEIASNVFDEYAKRLQIGSGSSV